MADCVGDVPAVADALGLERFAIWGGSGGGPHADLVERHAWLLKA